jgi:hypothetical protein
MIIYIHESEYIAHIAVRYYGFVNSAEAGEYNNDTMESKEVREMRKGILSLSLPGMRKGRGKGKTAAAGQAAEHKTVGREEPKVEIKAEKPLVQTIMIPKPSQVKPGVRSKSLPGASHKPKGKR